MPAIPARRAAPKSFEHERICAHGLRHGLQRTSCLVLWAG